jgi:hypothetical protein
MNRRKIWIAISIVFVALLIGVLFWSSMSLARYEVQVCMTFNGRTQCRVAAGNRKMDALRTATDNACSFIASGVTETMNCGRTPPSSVTWLKDD